MVMGKALANCNELSLSSLVKTSHLYTMLNLQLAGIYFIITCGTKMVYTFALLSVVRG